MSKHLCQKIEINKNKIMKIPEFFVMKVYICLNFLKITLTLNRLVDNFPLIKGDYVNFCEDPPVIFSVSSFIKSRNLKF